MQWNACVHRLDLGLYFHPNEFLGNGVRTHVNSKGNIPSTGGSEEGGTCDTASSRTESPTHYPLSYCGPNPRHCIRQDREPYTLPTELFRPKPVTLHQAGQPAQHTTNCAILAPTRYTASSRTASPTHYQWAIVAPVDTDSLVVFISGVWWYIYPGFPTRMVYL